MNKFLFITVLLIITINTVSSQEIKKDLTPKLDSIIEKNLILDQDYLKSIKFIFGIDKDEIPLSEAITLIAFFIAFFIAIKKVISAVNPDFLNEEIKKIIFSIIITLLISISGGMLFSSQISSDISNVFKFLDNWEFASLIVQILFIVIVIILISSLTSKLKRYSEDEKRKENLEIIKEGSKKIK